MKEEKKPWHQLVMVCPKCGDFFCPAILGIHVRLCPQCEATEKRLHKEVFSKNLEKSRESDGLIRAANLGRE
jgi:hypothetical protein